MEVILDKRYPVNASVEQAWALLSDIRATASCMPGATITEQVDETHYKGSVKSKVGPATMQFGGDIEVLGIDASTQSIQMLGKGSDKGGSSASMDLSARIEQGDEPGHCTLVGQATIVASGKLAQFGSRLLVPVSDVLLAQFAKNFSLAAAQVQMPEASHSSQATQANDVSLAGHTTQENQLIQTSALHPSTQHDASGSVKPLPPQPQPVAAQTGATDLNALSLIWAVIKSWFAGLFSSRAKPADRPDKV